MTQIGKYEIVRRTGQTPLGTIYEAFDPVMRRTVSIQAPEDETPAREPMRRQTYQIALQKGGESLGRLHHPNIRNIIASEEVDGALYLVMEHLHARSVFELIPPDGLPAAEALRLLRMTGLALDHAHGQNVFHPGLTPAHLLVDDDGLLKVAGFEMSGLQPSSTEMMSAAEIDELLGSAPYRSPEFLAGEPVDARADQFSLAVIAVELLSGQAVFSCASPITAMAKILSANGPDLRFLDARLPSAGRRVLEKALSSDPAGRYASCTATLDALEAVLVRKAALPTKVMDSPHVAKPPEAEDAKPVTALAQHISEQPSEVQEQHARRTRWLVAAACVAAVLVMALIFLQWRSRPAKQAKHIPAPAVSPLTPSQAAKPNPLPQAPVPSGIDTHAALPEKEQPKPPQARKKSAPKFRPREPTVNE